MLRYCPGNLAKAQDVGYGHGIKMFHIYLKTCAYRKKELMN